MVRRLHRKSGEKAKGEIEPITGPESSDFRTLTLVCRSPANKSGLLRVKFPMLVLLALPVRRAIWDCLVDKSHRSRSSTWAYQLRGVFSTMVAQEQIAVQAERPIRSLTTRLR